MKIIININGGYDLSKVRYGSIAGKLMFDAIKTGTPINELPERQTGHWILQSDYNDKLYGWYYCSECGAYIGEQTNYCSECGAKMT